MYGLVNLALEELLVTQFGKPMWKAIIDDVAPDFPGFLSMEVYPDALTYDILAEAVKRTGVSREELLRRLGHVWIHFTMRRGFGDLLDLTGDSLSEFLGRLDSLHQKLASVYPELKPPRFETRRHAPGELALRYFSDRPGLAHFVIGLLEGLAEKYRVDVTIDYQPRATPKSPDVFVVAWDQD